MYAPPPLFARARPQNNKFSADESEEEEEEEEDEDDEEADDDDEEEEEDAPKKKVSGYRWPSPIASILDAENSRSFDFLSLALQAKVTAGEDDDEEEEEEEEEEGAFRSRGGGVSARHV